MIKLIDRLKKFRIIQELVAKIQYSTRKHNFKKDLSNFNKSGLLSNKRFSNNIIIEPYLNDNSQKTYIEPHYTYHPAWAARVLANNQPKKHVDISSILHFSTILSAFIPTDFYDYRPARITLVNHTSNHADLTSLPFETNSIESLSCMHTIEHVGLGRYGDPINYDGDLEAIAELKRVLSIGGALLVVVPIGKPKIVFNAHRIYSFKQLISYFSDLKLVEFSLIPDSYEADGIIFNATREQADLQTWGCGCFHFKK